MERPMWIIIGIVGAIFVAWMVFGALPMAQHNQRRADAEKKFIAQMIPHHDAAIMMAKMAEQKAQTVQIKNLSGNIIETQQREINDMRQWYKAWFGEDIAIPENAHGDHAMTEMAPDLSKLNDAADFDLEFVKEMTVHHQAAITMSQDFLPNAMHAQLKGLAQDIIDAQNNEITIMQDLQKLFETYPAGSPERIQ